MLDSEILIEWANFFGIGLTLFYSWESFVEQALFWAEEPKPIAAAQAVGFIHKRLIAVEASPKAVELWISLTREKVTE